MKKKIYSILIVLLITVLATSTVYAGGGVSLKGASISSGSPLTLNGTVTGLTGFTQGVTITLLGFGEVMSVTCTSPGGQTSPGQNPGRIVASGTEEVSYSVIKNGGYRVKNLYAEPQARACPNGNWTANFIIAWDTAEVIVTDNATGAELLHEYFTCFPSDPNNPSAYTCTQNQ